MGLGSHRPLAEESRDPKFTARLVALHGRLDKASNRAYRQADKLQEASSIPDATNGDLKRLAAAGHPEATRVMDTLLRGDRFSNIAHYPVARAINQIDDNHAKDYRTREAAKNEQAAATRRAQEAAAAQAEVDARAAKQLDIHSIARKELEAKRLASAPSPHVEAAIERTQAAARDKATPHATIHGVFDTHSLTPATPPAGHDTPFPVKTPFTEALEAQVAPPHPAPKAYSAGWRPLTKAEKAPPPSGPAPHADPIKARRGGRALLGIGAASAVGLGTLLYGAYRQRQEDAERGAREAGAKTACARYGVQDLWPYFV